MIASDLRYALDPVLFVKDNLKISFPDAPDPWQEEVLRGTGDMMLNCTRQAGKSTTTAAKGLHKAIYTPKSLTILVSPSQRQSGELFKKVQDQMGEMIHPPKLEEDNKTSCTLVNGSRIVSLPGEERTIRGFSSAALIIEDEASRVKDELNAAISPMRAISHGQLIEMSTPFGKRGHFFKSWTEDGDLWKRIEIPWWKCPRISKEFIASERVKFGDWWIRQEYECEFVQTSDQVFSYDLVLASMSDDIEPLFLGGEA